MRRWMLAWVIVAAACGKDHKTADGDKAEKKSKKVSDDDDDDRPKKKASSQKSLCKRACKKLLECIDAPDGEQDDCVDKCSGGGKLDDDRVERIEEADCTQLAKELGALSGQGQGQGRQGGTPAGCKADCTGCVGDNSSCYMAAGGAHGIPCDACCCAPGGPSPTWRTPE